MESLTEYRKYLGENNRWAFLEKWDYGFTSVRKDILDVMDISPGMKILDIGCSEGKTLEFLKDNYISYDLKLYGVEPDRKSAIKAKKFGRISAVSAEKFLKASKVKFDIIIMADVIEHLKEPWIVVREAVKHLKDSGAVYVSIPNYFHSTVMYNLFECGSFGYASNDIINKEHLRFFTMNDSVNLLKMAGLNHFDIYGNTIDADDKPIEVASKLQDLFKKDYHFDVYQFVIKGTK